MQQVQPAHGTENIGLHIDSTRVADMTSRRRLRSSTSHRLEVFTVGKRAFPVSGDNLKRPASPHRICAVTRGFHTTTQGLSFFPFLPRHYHMTRLTIHHYWLDTCDPRNN